MRHLFLLSLISLLLTDCATTKTTPLTGKWYPKSLEGKGFTSGPEEAYLELNLQDKLVSGHDGCNQFSGSIEEVGEKALVFGPMRSTRRACPDKERQYPKFHRALAQTVAYRMEGRVLILLSESGEEVLAYRKADPE